MPIQYVQGDPFLTKMQTLAFGYNMRAKTENDVIGSALEQRYPAAIATFRKQANSNRIKTGDVWIWTESSPRIALLVVRDSSVGATRSRYVDNAALKLIRDYRLQGIESLAIAPLGREAEIASIKEALNLLMGKCPFPLVVYDKYIAGVQAEE